MTIVEAHNFEAPTTALFCSYWEWKKFAVYKGRCWIDPKGDSLVSPVTNHYDLIPRRTDWQPFWFATSLEQIWCQRRSISSVPDVGQVQLVFVSPRKSLRMARMFWAFSQTMSSFQRQGWQVNLCRVNSKSLQVKGVVTVAPASADTKKHTTGCFLLCCKISACHEWFIDRTYIKQIRFTAGKRR